MRGGPGRARLPVQRSPGHRQDLHGPDPGQGPQLRRARRTASPAAICPNCLAVDQGRIVDWLLELDAASNNGVANIRELIERIPLGTSGNRKVVILDEVHMLSTGAANALLKSLEEPPAHVVFILATTDPQKVLPTIRSRTQHFEFHLLPADVLADHVRHVIEDAGLGLGEDAVDHVVRQGGGSARDTLSALDQVSAMGGVVEQTQPVEAILEALVGHDAGAALVAVADATDAGRDPRALGEVLIARAARRVPRGDGSARPAPPARRPGQGGRASAAPSAPAGLTRALEVLGEALVELAKKPDPRIVLEVALVRLCRPDADRSLDAVLDRLERLERSTGDRRRAPAPAPAAGTPAAPPPAPAERRAPPAPPRPDRPSRRRAGPLPRRGPSSPRSADARRRDCPRRHATEGPGDEGHRQSGGGSAPRANRAVADVPAAPVRPPPVAARAEPRRAHARVGRRGARCAAPRHEGDLQHGPVRRR